MQTREQHSWHYITYPYACICILIVLHMWLINIYVVHYPTWSRRRGGLAFADIITAILQDI